MSSTDASAGRRERDMDGRRIAEHMRRADAVLGKAIRAASPDARLRDGPTVDQLMQRLIEHETLRHGQVINFLYCRHLPVPESWQQEWALPS